MIQSRRGLHLRFSLRRHPSWDTLLVTGIHTCNSTGRDKLPFGTVYLAQTGTDPG